MPSAHEHAHEHTEDGARHDAVERVDHEGAEPSSNAATFSCSVGSHGWSSRRGPGGEVGRRAATGC